MTEQHYLRKLQRHGTGRESHYPPEVCEALGIDAGDDVDFVIGPGNNVALRKPGTSQQQVNSPMDPEKTITLFYSKHGCIISGKRGCGKTSLAKKFCQDHWRIIYYDTLGKYTDGVFTKDLQKFESFLAKVQHGNFRIIYRPLHPERTIDCEFDSICELVNESKNLTFLVEHLDRYCDPSPSTSLPLKELIRDGCDKRIKLIGTTQKPQSVDKRLINNAGQIYQLVSLPTQSSPQLSEPEGRQRNPELEAALSDSR